MRRATAAAAVALLAALPLVAGSPAALADPPVDARTRAAQLAAQVRHLRTAQEQAAEAYDAVSSQLAAAVSARLDAQQHAEQAHAAATRSTTRAGAQARALYESGGALALYAGLLQAGDTTGVLDRARLAAGVARSNRATGEHAAARASATDINRRALDAAAQEQARLERASAASAARVTTLLAEQESALADADEQVRELAAQEEQRQREAEQAQFAASLADAYAAAGEPLLLGTAGGAAASPLADRAVAAMAALVSVHPAYLWGGSGPEAFDCSGLTLTAYTAAGLRLPRTAAEQYLTGLHPALSDLRPGDLLFWGSSPPAIHHVAMYAGGGLMWSTNHSGDVARLQPVWGAGLLGATRPA